MGQKSVADNRRRRAKRDLVGVAKLSIKGLLGADLAGLVPAMDSFLVEHRHLGEVDDVVAFIHSKCRIPDDLRRRGFSVVAEMEGDRLTLHDFCGRWKFTYADRSIAQSHLEEDARRARRDVGPATTAWLASVRRRVALGDEVRARRADDPEQPWKRFSAALLEECQVGARLAEAVHPCQEAYRAACKLAPEGAQGRARAPTMSSARREAPVEPAAVSQTGRTPSFA